MAYGTYWHRRLRDTTRGIVVPVIWTQGALHTSIVTACIPSIERFFTNAQSGLMGVQITEQHGLTHASKKGTRSTVLSQQDDRSTHHTNQHAIPDKEPGLPRDGAQHLNTDVYSGSEDIESRARVRGGLSKNRTDETESMKGLTSDVIHERRDFTLEAEDGDSGHSN